RTLCKSAAAIMAAVTSGGGGDTSAASRSSSSCSIVTSPIRRAASDQNSGYSDGERWGRYERLSRERRCDREAELLAGTPEAAAAWMKERSSKSWYFWAEGDQHTEGSLLGMGSRLIDLAFGTLQSKCRCAARALQSRR